MTTTTREAELVLEALRRRFPDVERITDGYCARCPCHGQNGELWLITFDVAGATQGCTSGRCSREAIAAAVSGKPAAAQVLADRILRLSTDGLRATPPARVYMLKDSNTDAGVYVQGKVGILAAPGGSGKSWAFTQLAVAQATGATWFGSGGWTPVTPGRVLLVLAEEDEDEVRRRLHFAAAAMGLNDELLDLVARDVDALPLAGYSVSLTHEDRGDELPETPFAAAMRERLRDAVAAARPYTLVILDPLSRFAGLDAEVDNAAATRWVQVVETFTLADCGRPSVLIAHHLKKRGDGEGDPESADMIRGASALVAGARWAARLEQQKREEDAADLLTLRIVKANGVPPQLQPLILCRDQRNEGALRVATRGEVDSHQLVSNMVKTKLQKLEDHRDRVLRAMQPRRYYSRNQLAEVCGKKTLVLEAVRQLLAEGLLLEPLRHKLCLASDPPPLLRVVPGGEPQGTTTGTDGGKAVEQGGSRPGTLPPKEEGNRGTTDGSDPGSRVPTGSVGTGEREPVDRQPGEEG